jgi:hypothetical protein
MLFDWVHRCRDTRFGLDHGFGEITSLAGYRRHVPISRYDYFAPYINAVAGGKLGALFPPDERVERFTITTGSTGTPKLNPVTPTWLKEYRRAWDLWGSKMLSGHLPKVGDKILKVIGSRDMGHTPGGIPISTVSALPRKPVALERVTRNTSIRRWSPTRPCWTAFSRSTPSRSEEHPGIARQEKVSGWSGFDEFEACW